EEIWLPAGDSGHGRPAILPRRRACSWDRASASYRPMAKQQGGEFASTDPATRTQDARFQKRRVSTEISLLSCSSPQHLQRPTPSHFSKHTPSVQGLGHADVARSRCCSVSKIVNEIVRVYRSTT